MIEFADLSKSSQARVAKALKKFNGIYSQAIKSIKEKIRIESDDFLDELRKLEVLPYGLSFMYGSRNKKRVDDEADEFFYFNKPTSALDNVSLALHVLNQTEQKISDYVITFGKAARSNPRLLFLPEIIDDCLRERCRKYLLDLPEELTINGLKDFGKLPDKYAIPSIFYNYNHDLVRKLREELVTNKTN